MLDHNPGGVVLSTDEYFIRNGYYHYEPDLLGEAHEWNHKRGELHTRPVYFQPIQISDLSDFPLS